MESLLSASAEVLQSHPHLFDGSLGRALAYLGLALMLGVRLWLDAISNTLLGRLKAVQLTALGAGWMGALLALNASVLEAAAPFAQLGPFAQSGTEPNNVTLDDYVRLLLGTSYGKTWLLYCTLLTIGTAVLRKPLPALIACVGAVAALAASSHAGERGWATPQYLLDVVHLSLALTWLGGVAVLAGGRLGKAWRVDDEALQRFSGVALPIFILAVLTGIGRLGLQYVMEQGLATIYLLMLGLKLLAIVGVIICAWQLRGILRREEQDLAYDNKLGTEVFCAALLLLFAALLTQTPPN